MSMCQFWYSKVRFIFQSINISYTIIYYYILIGRKSCWLWPPNSYLVRNGWIQPSYHCPSPRKTCPRALDWYSIWDCLLLDLKGNSIEFLLQCKTLKFIEIPAALSFKRIYDKGDGYAKIVQNESQNHINYVLYRNFQLTLANLKAKPRPEMQKCVTHKILNFEKRSMICNIIE